MRQVWALSSAAIVCAATVALAAQAPNSSPSQAPPSAAPQQQQPATASPSQAPSVSAQSTAKAVTFAGCIENAPAESGAAAPAAGGASLWVLTNASAAGGGAVGTAGGARPAARYRLDADNAKISPHAGHKVEVTGTLEEASASATTSSGAAVSASMPPILKVSTVKMIAATCP